MVRLLVVATLLFAACETLGTRTRLVTAEDVDWTDPALVRAEPGVRLYRIDAQQFPYRELLEVEVPVGSHEVVLGYLGNDVGPQWLQSVDPVVVTFDAEPGRTYVLKATYEIPEGGGPSKHYPWTARVVDVTDAADPRDVAAAESVGLVSVTPKPW